MANTPTRADDTYAESSPLASPEGIIAPLLLSFASGLQTMLQKRLGDGRGRATG